MNGSPTVPEGLLSMTALAVLLGFFLYRISFSHSSEIIVIIRILEIVDRTKT